MVVWAIVLLVFATGTACASADGADGTPGLPKQLADPTVGWSLRYPAGWSVRGRVAATAFAQRGRCRTTIVVDEASSGIGSELRSFVQVCSRARADELTLERFLRQTYGTAFAGQFEQTQIGGRTAFRTRRSAPTLVFVQTRGFRIQLASSVSAEPGLRARRRSEVAAVLRSFALGEPRAEGSQ